MENFRKYATLSALAVAFYGILSPLAFLLRLLGYDPLRRQLDKNAKTYRLVRDRHQGRGFR